MKRIITIVLALLLAASPTVLFASAENELIVVAFGDSITAADKWQKYVEKELGIDIINKGVGGDSTRTAKSRFKKDVLALKPDVVFISFGTNDAAIDMAKYTPIEDYKKNLEYYIDECSKIGAKVIINLPPPIDDEPYLTRHDSKPFEPYGGPNALLTLYVEAAVQVAGEMGVVCNDVYSVFIETGRYSNYLSDGVHPTDAGYKIYGEAAITAYDRLWAGDVNANGKIESLDYALAKRGYLGTYTLGKDQLRRADINRNELLDILDYASIKRHYLGTYDIVNP